MARKAAMVSPYAILNVSAILLGLPMSDIKLGECTTLSLSKHAIQNTTGFIFPHTILLLGY